MWNFYSSEVCDPLVNGVDKQQENLNNKFDKVLIETKESLSNADHLVGAGI